MGRPGSQVYQIITKSKAIDKFTSNMGKPSAPRPRAPWVSGLLQHTYAAAGGVRTTGPPGSLGQLKGSTCFREDMAKVLHALGIQGTQHQGQNQKEILLIGQTNIDSCSGKGGS